MSRIKRVRAKLGTLRFCIRRVFAGVPILLGVTLISFVLMVYFGPDKTYSLLSKNPTPQEIAEVRHSLGYDRPFVVRYLQYLKEIATLDFGNSDSTGEKISAILGKTFPISAALNLPAFFIGNILSIFLALLAAFYRSTIIDKAIMVVAVIGMSISLLIIAIVFQIIFCSSDGLGWFPVQGWDTSSFISYLDHVTVPTLVVVFVALGYNTRFYRAVFVEEMTKDHIRTARAFGCPNGRLLYKYIFKNSLIPIITQIVATLPFIFIGGSLVVESYFSIPGIGLATFEAITSGDEPMLKAVVAITSVAYVLALMLMDILYKVVDPRVSI